MYGENLRPNSQEPPDLPAPEPSWSTPAAPIAWASSEGSPAYWSLRPVGGGAEWEVEPRYVRPAVLIEQLRARTARLNARSRGEVL